MTIFEIKLKDGRVFRVATTNRNQVKRLNVVISKLNVLSTTTILNGINTIKEFEKIV